MKFFFITIFVFILSTPSIASVKEVKKMVYKSEKYNLGLKKKDTTVNGLKLKRLGYSCKLLEAQSNEITKPSARER